MPLEYIWTYVDVIISSLTSAKYLFKHSTIYLQQLFEKCTNTSLFKIAIFQSVFSANCDFQFFELYVTMRYSRLCDLCYHSIMARKVYHLNPHLKYRKYEQKYQGSDIHQTNQCSLTFLLCFKICDLYETGASFNSNTLLKDQWRSQEKKLISFAIF